MMRCVEWGDLSDDRDCCKRVVVRNLWAFSQNKIGEFKRHKRVVTFV